MDFGWRAFFPRLAWLFASMKKHFRCILCKDVREEKIFGFSGISSHQKFSSSVVIGEIQKRHLRDELMTPERKKLIPDQLIPDLCLPMDENSSLKKEKHFFLTPFFKEESASGIRVSCLCWTRNFHFTLLTHVNPRNIFLSRSLRSASGNPNFYIFARPFVEAKRYIAKVFPLFSRSFLTERYITVRRRLNISDVVYYFPPRPSIFFPPLPSSNNSKYYS